MTAQLPTLLVVDDEPKIRDAVRDALLAEAGKWLEAGSGREALALVKSKHPDLVVLDLGLPDMDGVDVCRAVRTWSNAPIIVLSARHSEEEKARLLDAGADDYVTKPFSTVEFRARVRAQLRRSRLGPVSTGDAPIVLGPLTVDLARHSVTRGEQTVHLAPTEWRLLHTLISHAGKTMTHRQLFDTVWGASDGDAQQYLRVYIAHLRRKIEIDTYAPRHIITEPGVGYRFEMNGCDD